MAEPLSPADFQLAVEHLQKFPHSAPCPICQTALWNVVGLQASSSYDGAGIRLGGMITPTLLVVCATCGYVREFAWLKIKPPSESPAPLTGGGTGG
jgi:predicted transporter